MSQCDLKKVKVDTGLIENLNHSQLLTGVVHIQPNYSRRNAFCVKLLFILLHIVYLRYISIESINLLMNTYLYNYWEIPTKQNLLDFVSGEWQILGKYWWSIYLTKRGHTSWRGYVYTIFWSFQGTFRGFFAAFA